MKGRSMGLGLLLAALLGGPVGHLGAETNAPLAVEAVVDPAQQLQEMTRALRRNDLEALVRAGMPAEKFQEVRQAYEFQRGRPLDPAEREQIDTQIARFTGPGAVDALMAEIEPKLAEARPQAEGAILMALGAAQMALASPKAELSPEQRAMLRSVLPGVQRWASSTDFLGSQTMRQAITLIVDAARSSGIHNVEQLRMLSLEELLAHGGRLLAASKQALRLYGLDADAIADSARYELLSIEGDKARIRASFRIFDADLAHEIELVLVEGRWQGSKSARHKFRLQASSEG